jgi:hypothetical protein
MSKCSDRACPENNNTLHRGGICFDLDCKTDPVQLWHSHVADKEIKLSTSRRFKRFEWVYEEAHFQTMHSEDCSQRRCDDGVIIDDEDSIRGQGMDPGLLEGREGLLNRAATNILRASVQYS